MLVHALIASVWTHPEPSVFLVFYCLDKVLAYLIGSCLWISMLAQDHLLQLLLVPIIHGILLLFFFLGFFVSSVRVQTSLLCLALDIEIMAEFALLALFTVALLKKLTQDGFGVDSKGDFLHLYRLEKFCCFLASLFRGGLFLLPLQFLGFLFLLGWRFRAC